jgi:hypothetical protein
MAEAERVVIGAGAAEKRVRVVEGRRRKEARSLEAIVAVGGAVRLLAAHDEIPLYGAEVRGCGLEVRRPTAAFPLRLMCRESRRYKSISLYKNATSGSIIKYHILQTCQCQ